MEKYVSRFSEAINKIDNKSIDIIANSVGKYTTLTKPEFYEVAQWNETSITSSGDWLGPKPSFSIRTTWEFKINFYDNTKKEILCESIGTFILVGKFDSKKGTSKNSYILSGTHIDKTVNKTIPYSEDGSL